MKTHTIIVMALSLLIYSQDSFALGVDNPVSRIFGNNSESAGPCPLSKYKVPDESYEQMDKQAFELKLSQRYCEANAYFRRMMALATQSGQKEHAWFELIESSFDQRDYDELFSQSTRFLQENPTSEKAERVYYLAIKAIDENIELTQGEESRWIQAGLGDSTQSPENTNPQGLPKPVFSYKAFLEKYPNSPYAVDVEAMLAKLRTGMGEKILKEVREDAIRWKFAPALNRLKVILAQGPSVDCFSEALFEAITITYEFGYRVQNPNQVLDTDLARWLIKDIKEITPELRKSLSHDLIAQADQMKKMMQEKLPNDRWTKKLY